MIHLLFHIFPQDHVPEAVMFQIEHWAGSATDILLQPCHSPAPSSQGHISLCRVCLIGHIQHSNVAFSYSYEHIQTLPMQYTHVLHSGNPRGSKPSHLCPISSHWSFRAAKDTFRMFISLQLIEPCWYWLACFVWVWMQNIQSDESVSLSFSLIRGNPHLRRS